MSSNQISDEVLADEVIRRLNKLIEERKKLELNK
jgi:hypothetical protein